MEERRKRVAQLGAQLGTLRSQISRGYAPPPLPHPLTHWQALAIRRCPPAYASLSRQANGG